jgi:energy-converting hydrogenase B subunit D
MECEYTSVANVMLRAVQALTFVMVGLGGTAVVFTRDPRRQALVLSVYGLILTVFFLLLQAPDVALSELAIGGAALPLMILVALVKRGRFRPGEDEPHAEVTSEADL